MLKHLPRSDIHFLLHIFNLSWSVHSFSSIWKTSSISPIHKMGKPLGSPASFRLIFLTSLIGALAWFIKITKVALFEFVEMFRKDSFLALCHSHSSSTTFWPLCLLPSAALSMLTIWSFGPPPPRCPLRWKPNKVLCFD